jgi:hypothetical protein
MTNGSEIVANGFGIDLDGRAGTDSRLQTPCRGPKVTGTHRQRFNSGECHERMELCRGAQ